MCVYNFHVVLLIVSVIFSLQNRNIEYITDTTCAEITVQAMWSGARDGLTVVIRHETITGIVNAEFLLYKLLEGVSNWL